MIRKYLIIVLVGMLIFNANLTLIFAQTASDRASNAEKIKADGLNRGLSDKKPVRVKMSDGTKMKGYISQIGEDSFTLTNSKTKQPTVIAYRDAAKIEGPGLAGGPKIGIIIGAAAGITLAALLIAFQNATRNN